MGHTRLGELPRTRKWQQVIALIGAGASVAQLANATMAAAERGLRFAAGDPGLVETIWLLTQIPLAARSDDFAAALRHTGLDVSDTPSLMEVAGAVSDCIDARVSKTGGRTDLGEMAQMAAAETMSKVVGTRTKSLFETTPEDVRHTFSALATNRQFSVFAREFFSRLTEKCLDYFLSRAFSYHVGDGHRFATLAQQADFSKALTQHCHEASRIVEDFSGGWFGKTNWEKGGISRQEAAGFSHVAMQKICAELQEGARPDVR